MLDTTTAAKIVLSENQSQRGPSWSAYCRQPRNSAISTSPIRSKWRNSDNSGLSMSINNHTVTATTMPGARLTRNNQCQDQVSVRKPPIVGPRVDDMFRISEISTMTVANCGMRNFV